MKCFSLILFLSFASMLFSCYGREELSEEEAKELEALELVEKMTSEELEQLEEFGFLNRYSPEEDEETIILQELLEKTNTSDFQELLDKASAKGLKELLENTMTKPWSGEEFTPGHLAGTWNTVMNEDPKSFNKLIAEQDSSTNEVVGNFHDYLLDYNVITKEWQPRIASAEVLIDETDNTMKVYYTLRNDLYWSYYNSGKKIKVTSDDVVFWYNEVQGDPECQSSGYYGQFVTLTNGSQAHIDIEKIDDLNFSFNFPRIIADPLLSTNMDFGPRHIYEPAKLEGGVQGIRDVFNVSMDPKIIPSMGEWFLVEYSPGQRLVYKRNQDYWRKDSNGLSVPFYEELIVRIIPDENTSLLLFKEGRTETYGLRPEDLDSLVNKNDGSYTVFNSEGALNAPFWTFNQNPQNRNTPQYEWFTKKEFRQAMSCLLNHQRINSQVYRKLAEPKLNIFPEPNPFYNPNITLKYLYDPDRAVELLESIGIKRDDRGIMRDSKNRPVEFNLSIRSESTVNSDIASIIRDELSKIGIGVNIRVVDFQKLVEQLFSTFDWESMIMALSGSGIFPSQGSNVWPSSGNLHLWHPNQKSPATDWEERIDYLYNEGSYTIDKEKAQEIWDEFQTIILEQCPWIHLMRSRGFWALNNRWDFTNVYFDNINGAEISHVFLR